MKSAIPRLPMADINVTPFVDVVVPKAKDLAAAQVIDAAAEVLSVEGEPFAGFAAWSPGLASEPTGPWPSAVPILYSDTPVPKAAKAESTVTETRPSGFCEKGAVQRVVMGRSGAYRACYEVELQRHPELAGRVEIRFTIEPDGTVSGVAATADDLGSVNVSQCLIKQVQGLNFPKPDGGVCVIRWPFKFQPGG